MGRSRETWVAISMQSCEQCLKKCIIPYSKPVDMVGVRRVTGATSVLFVTGTVNDDWVVEGSYRLRSQVKHFPSHNSNERDKHTLSGSIKGPHIENVNALHLSDKFETLKTSSLLEIGGNGTRLGTRGDQILLGLDLYTRKGPELAMVSQRRWVSCSRSQARECNVNGR
jgi:hypothetical protein